MTVLGWNLNRDGSLLGTPWVVRQEGITDANRPLAMRHAEQAIHAVELAAPFQLPDQYYNAWERVTAFRFDETFSQTSASSTLPFTVSSRLRQSPAKGWGKVQVVQPDLVLDFPPNRQDRRTLPNGTEFFGASGTVANVGLTRRTVPTILVLLRDRRERLVYSYEVSPTKHTLAPGETMTVNEAVTDVPKSARIAEFSWKPVPVSNP